MNHLEEAARVAGRAAAANAELTPARYREILAQLTENTAVAEQRTAGLRQAGLI